MHEVTLEVWGRIKICWQCIYIHATVHEYLQHSTHTHIYFYASIYTYMCVYIWDVHKFQTYISARPFLHCPQLRARTCTRMCVNVLSLPELVKWSNYGSWRMTLRTLQGLCMGWKSRSCMYVCMYVCVCMQACMYACKHVDIHTYIMHIRICSFMRHVQSYAPCIMFEKTRPNSCFCSKNSNTCAGFHGTCVVYKLYICVCVYVYVKCMRNVFDHTSNGGPHLHKHHITMT
jgi:hypothetical protein